MARTKGIGNDHRVFINGKQAILFGVRNKTGIIYDEVAKDTLYPRRLAVNKRGSTVLSLFAREVTRNVETFAPCFSKTNEEAYGNTANTSAVVHSADQAVQRYFVLRVVTIAQTNRKVRDGDLYSCFRLVVISY